jgi:hypothetical protein
MVSSEYYRKQADLLILMAQADSDATRAAPLQHMAAVFQARADAAPASPASDEKPLTGFNR